MSKKIKDVQYLYQLNQSDSDSLLIVMKCYHNSKI